jgi:hypothetical protein
MQDLRPITKEEWGKYDWIQVKPHVYIQGIEKSDPPEEPQDGNVHDLADITTYADKRRVYAWEPRMTPK